MASLIHWLLVGLIWIAVLSSLFLWARFLTRSLTSPSPMQLVPLHSQQRPFWSPAEFLVMFGLLIIGLFLLRDLFVNQGWIEAKPVAGEQSIDSLVGSLVINSLAGIIAGSMTLGWLCYCYPGALRQLGLWPSWSQIGLGLRGSLWLLPPIGLISLTVSLLVPYEHPVLDTLAASPTTTVFMVMFVGTAVVAPVVEEFMFRVLLQGGLQRLADRNCQVDQDYQVVAKDDPSASSGDKSPDSELLSSTESLDPIATAYRPPTELAEADNEQVRAQWAPKSYWPMVVTSLLFALMHSGQGAAPIPLFFLSIGLGYLYRQTGKITAPLIVHIVLNSTTMIVEFTRIATEAGS